MSKKSKLNAGPVLPEDEVEQIAQEELLKTERKDLRLEEQGTSLRSTTKAVSPAPRREILLKEVWDYLEDHWRMVPELVRSHLAVHAVFRWTDMQKDQQARILELVVVRLHDRDWIQKHIDFMLKMDRSWAWSRILHGVISSAVYRAIEEQL